MCPEFIEELCERFTRSVNPLFIPRIPGWSVGSCQRNLGIRHTGNAIGYSPFGIDRLAGSDMELAHAYDFLSQISPLILANQGKRFNDGGVAGQHQCDTEGSVGELLHRAHISCPVHPVQGPPICYPEKVAGLFHFHWSGQLYYREAGT